MQQHVLKLMSISLVLLATGCSSLNPFGGEPESRSQYPAGSVQYACDDNNRFVLQFFNQDQNVWLIYPDHQVNLVKSADSNTYTSGVITLEIAAEQTVLNDGEKIAYTGCKPKVK